MTAQDRQKLAETVRTAFAAHYRTGNYADLGMAMQDVQNDLLAALAQPCQECDRLRASRERHKRANDQHQDELAAAESELASLREKLAEAEKRASDLAKVSWDATQRRQDAEARAVQAEREREKLLLSARTNCELADKWQIECGRLGEEVDAAEARAQRYREALWSIASGAWMEDAPRHKYSVRVFARRALSADPLVCRDPSLCWGTGTCPRDPACNE